MTKKRNEGPGADSGIAAQCVRLLLNRHSVARGQGSRVVAEVLGLQDQQGRRKLTGKSPWTLDQLRAVGAHFGESLEQVLEPALRDGWVQASLVIGAWRAQGFALLGPVVEPPFQCDLVAVGSAGQWVVVPAGGINMQAHEVRHLALRSANPRPAATGAPGAATPD